MSSEMVDKLQATINIPQISTNTLQFRTQRTHHSFCCLPLTSPELKSGIYSVCLTRRTSDKIKQHLFSCKNGLICKFSDLFTRTLRNGHETELSFLLDHRLLNEDYPSIYAPEKNRLTVAQHPIYFQTLRSTEGELTRGLQLTTK